MSKKRLEEIKKFYKDDLEIAEHAGVCLTKDDYLYLINQAERVQEYDRELISLEDNKHYVSEILEKNKRYKQFIEHFAYCDEDYEGMLRLQNKAKKLIEGENRD